MSTADDSVLSVAIQAARSAAAVITDAARDLVRLPTFSKDHGDIVSTADVEAEDAIVATLRTAFPGYAILGEESGHIAGAREGSGHKWIVDPIDGTVNFIHGFPYYAVSIALAHGTDVTHAVVYHPCTTTASPRSRVKAHFAMARPAGLDVHRSRPGADRYRVSDARKSETCSLPAHVQPPGRPVRRIAARRFVSRWTWPTWLRGGSTASG